MVINKAVYMRIFILPVANRKKMVELLSSAIFFGGYCGTTCITVKAY